MIEQGTEEWLQQRSGKITASRFCDVMAKSKRDGKPLKAREDYALEKAVEIITGKPIITPSTVAMQHGTDTEPHARAEYEVVQGCIVTEAPFILKPGLDYIGASADGFVGEPGLIEIKCPLNPAVHLKTLMHGMPEQHMAQVQGQMWVTDRQWCDFVSFHADYPEEYRLYIERIPRNDKYIALLEAECVDMWQEVQAMIAKVGALETA